MSAADRFAAARTRGLSHIKSHFTNNEFTHATGSGTATPSMQRAGEQLLIGGKVATIRRTLFIETPLFTVAPLARQPLTFNGVEYRIADVATSADGQHYEIALTGLNELG
jgi:hypothetical protein